ncbi:unnamed protein product [Adineta ricciae]|uniref:HMG box domain-containing protein n=1 Tax=Adineta ricciae TaxID=249248 RepID=A0A813U1C7_ADIRI|nr:unnamed protein product [Adineta ricciae]CAF1005873.1 unnamed protein product [Adineta ricciae]
MPKPSRSPLYFYAVEYQRRQHTRRQYMNISEAIAACYDDWKALSDEDRQPYKNQFQEWRLQSRLSPESANVSQQYTKPKKGIANDNVLQKRDIPCTQLKHHYDRFTTERTFLACEYLPLDKSELLAMPIYILNFQIFCKLDEEDGGKYLPAEMCILRYTLNDGVTTYKHRFIKPEMIPTGYMSSCLEHAKETHEIPLKDFGEASNNYKSIFRELKSFLTTTMMNQLSGGEDERTRRRYSRMVKPCVFSPAVEHEQTSKLFDWLQEKSEGQQPTKESRLVNFASIESLIMVLADLKKHHVSRDDIQRTFENASYSYLVDQRCPYHSHLGIRHCSVVRCHAAAKLISAYLNQLYVPERPASSVAKIGKATSNPFVNIPSPPPTTTVRSDPCQVQQQVVKQPTLSFQKYHQSHESSSDSLAPCYNPINHEQRHNSHQFNDEIVRLQQQNFHRLLSDAESSNREHRTDNQRALLNQHRQILLRALQTIEQQIEELDLE